MGNDYDVIKENLKILVLIKKVVFISGKKNLLILHHFFQE